MDRGCLDRKVRGQLLKGDLHVGTYVACLNSHESDSYVCTFTYHMSILPLGCIEFLQCPVLSIKDKEQNIRI